MIQNSFIFFTSIQRGMCYQDRIERVHTHKLLCQKFCVPLDIFSFLHLPLHLHKFYTKIVLFYSGSGFTLKYWRKKKNNLNANAYKPQDEKLTSRLNRGVDFGTYSYKRVKSTQRRASSWHQQRLSSGSKEKTVPSKVSPILNPSWKTNSSDIQWRRTPPLILTEYAPLDKQEVWVMFG